MTKMLCSSYAGGKGTRWSFTQGESLLLNSGTKMSMICTKIYWGVIDFTNDFFFLATPQGMWDLSYPNRD